MAKFPQVDISYNSGRYTANIKTDEKNTIITDGESFDVLLRNIDDAFKSHFDKEDVYSIKLNIPTVSFNYTKDNNAVVV